MAGYERKITVPVDAVFEAMAKGLTAVKFPGAKGVRISSKSLRTFFNSGPVCAGCGLTASFFAIERHKRQESRKYHLNLYGLKAGKEVIFTHDHIVARSLGGTDTLDNMRTMCGPCNWAKGQKEQKLFTKFKAGEITEEQLHTLIAELV